MTNNNHAAQAQRRRFNDQVLEETLGTIQLSEKVIKDVLAGEENLNSGCRKYGLDGNQMQYLLYAMRTLLENGERKFTRKELDEVLDEYGHPDCVERLYRSVFIHTVGVKPAMEMMPKDAIETVGYICDHPSEFLLSEEEGEILRLVHLMGKGSKEAAEELGIKIENLKYFLSKIKKKLSTRKNACFLLFGMNEYPEYQQEMERKRRTVIDSFLEEYEQEECERPEEAATDPDYISEQTPEGVAIEELDLSNRSSNALKRAGIMTVEAIAGLSYSDMLQIRNLGEKSILEIIHEVQKFIPEWPPAEGTDETVNNHDEPGERTPENITIEELDLSTRVSNVFKHEGIMTVKDILSLSYIDMFTLKNLGDMSIREIIHKVQKFVPDWIPADIPATAWKRINMD